LLICDFGLTNGLKAIWHMAGNSKSFYFESYITKTDTTWAKMNALKKKKASTEFLRA
jgi:hypothetical protein